MSSVSEPAHDRKRRAVTLTDRRRDLIGRAGTVPGRENAGNARSISFIHDDVALFRGDAGQKRIGRKARAQDEDDVRRLCRAVDHERVRPLGAADLKAVLFSVVILHVAADLTQEIRLRRGVRPAQVLSSVRDLAALRGDIRVDFMGVSKYQMAA